MDSVQMGRRIARLRKERALSQAQLGEMLGVSNKTISRWETGVYLPPADMLLALSEIFEISIHELINGGRPESKQPPKETPMPTSLEPSCFTIQEKIAFFKAKWIREHIPSICFCFAGILLLLCAGIFLRRPLLASVSVFLVVICHCIRHNAMMTYVERHAYEEKESSDAFSNH